MGESQIRLSVQNLHWIEGLDASQDLCAHGDVVFEIDGRPVWKDGGGDLCVSAAAMNLLRTLERDHVEGDLVTFTLFPCCGHVWDLIEEYGLVNIADCPNGRDATVEHRNDQVIITSPNGTVAQVSDEDWADQVCIFADRVEEFYRQSGPKEVHERDKEWYELFWEEWEARRAQYN